MNFFDVFANDVLWVPLTAFLIAQVLKTAINAAINRKFSISRLFGDGGMPSGHSATVSALATMVGFEAGFGTPLFAISVIFAIIVMHDAHGVRRETGKQAESIISISHLLNEYFEEKNQVVKTEKLKVLVGHTPLQVIFGALLGCVVAIFYCLVLK